MNLPDIGRFILCGTCRSAGIDGARAKPGQVCANCGRQAKKERGAIGRKPAAPIGSIIILCNATQLDFTDSTGDWSGSQTLPAGSKGRVVGRYTTPEYPKGIMEVIFLQTSPEKRKHLVNAETTNWEKVGTIPKACR